MSEQLRHREGDQPIPTVGQENVQEALVQDLLQLIDFNGGKGHQVIDDLQTRTALGIKRYGTPLQTFNERDAKQDLYEELLDAAQYCKQVLMETKSPKYRIILWVILGYIIDLRS